MSLTYTKFIESSKQNFNDKHITYPFINSENKKQMNRESVEKLLQETIESLFFSNNKFVISCKQNVIKLIAKRVVTSAPIVFSLAGESASGKSTAMDLFKESFHKNYIPYTVMSDDDYFRDITKEVEEAGGIDNMFKQGFTFDDPARVDLELCQHDIAKLKKGYVAYSPAYEFITHASTPGAIRKEPANFILHEGIFALNDCFNEVSDVKIYCDTPEDVIDKRWYAREEERGFSKSEQAFHYELVKQGAKKFIRPSRSNADMIIAGDCSKEEITVFFDKLVEIFSGYCHNSHTRINCELNI